MISKRILWLLKNADRPMSTADVANELRANKHTCRRALSELAGLGLIRRLGDCIHSPVWEKMPQKVRAARVFYPGETTLEQLQASDRYLIAYIRARDELMEGEKASA